MKAKPLFWGGGILLFFLPLLGQVSLTHRLDQKVGSGVGNGDRTGHRVAQGGDRGEWRTMFGADETMFGADETMFGADGGIGGVRLRAG